MEKRDKTALWWTVKRRTLFVSLALAGITVLITVLTPSHPLRGKRDRWTQLAVERVPTQVSKELVKIYGIIKSQLPTASDREVWKISDTISKESSKHKIDPMLVLAVIEVESKFQHAAVSPAGARGLMQIQPAVAKSLFHRITLHQDNVIKPFKPEYLHDPIFNIKLGIFYLKDLNRKFRNIKLVLAAYNAGPTEIRNRLDNEIEVSDEYAAKVLSTYQIYRKAKPPMF